MSQQLIKDCIDSMCFNCAKRILHFQIFTFTTQSPSSSYYWLMKYLDEKKKQETTKASTIAALGCGVCFGLLEKFSQTEYLEQVANDIRASGIQFNDFRISLTAPNLSTLREVNRITKCLIKTLPSQRQQFISNFKIG